jgi:hypothetical protein
MKKRDAVMAIFWVLLGLTISIWSATFPFGSRKSPGAGFLPMTVGLILILLGSILFFQTIKRKEKASGGTYPPLIPEGAAFKRFALTLAGMFLSVVFLEYLGFILTAFFLLLFLMRAIQPQKWRVAVFYSLASAISSFVLFRVFLKTPLPPGFVGF